MTLPPPSLAPQLRNFVGSFGAWVAEGLPVVKGGDGDKSAALEKASGA